MKYDLLISIILAIISFVVYKFHIYWLKNIKYELTSKEGSRLNKVQHWIVILGTAIFSVIYFFKFVTHVV